MNSFVCEGRLVAAAVVARLRFAVESVPVMGALDSVQDESLHDFSLLKILQRPGAGRPSLLKCFQFVSGTLSRGRSLGHW